MSMTFSELNRRAFVKLSTGAALAAGSGRLLAGAAKPTIYAQGGSVKVAGPNYSWEYSRDGDRFTLRDSQDRAIATGKLQAAVVVAPADQPSARLCTPGTVSGYQVDGSRVTFSYEKVNGSGRLSIAWRFDEHGIWTEPVVYEASTPQEIVSFHYFADGSEKRLPGLYATYYVVPGALSGSTVSPVMNQNVHLDESVWLGRGSFIPGLSQQWGLPVHYFCGFSAERLAGRGERDMFTQGRSEAFTCGLADLPAGDLFLQMNEGKVSPWIDYRSDLWHHLRTPGKLTLGATLFWSVAPDYYESIAAYYAGLTRAGVIRPKRNSARKTGILLTPEFCTWGAQRTRGKTQDNLDEAFLNGLYKDFQDSGMKAGLFSIDDKWEGTYGKLEHSAERLPHFEEFLAKLRADGLKVGLWAAVMRCERPSDLGLTEDNVLKQPDGTPFTQHYNGLQYFIMDFTQPKVAAALSDVVRRFVRRYKPDVFKFDFGYELPSVAIAAPLDKSWSGERLMWKGLEIVIKAMREENPDQVVMYYNLSPLFLDYFDLHSPDDLYLDVGDYEVEANRRFFFSSLMGRLGVPTYGSSGYDWASSPAIWFDSAALGTVGSLNEFRNDEEGESATPEVIAKYNGIAKALRPTNFFEILPLGGVSVAPSRGAHARSWARFEGGELVLLAYRPVPPGEENPLADRVTDSRVKDVVRSSFAVVVSSQGNAGLTRSANLAIVPYAGGEVSVRRQQGEKAEVVSHYFGGSSVIAHASIQNGFLTLIAVQVNLEGKPLEWIEVRIT
jgi:hypothetical protein